MLDGEVFLPRTVMLSVAFSPAPRMLYGVHSYSPWCDVFTWFTLRTPLVFFKVLPLRVNLNKCAGGTASVVQFSVN